MRLLLAMAFTLVACELGDVPKIEPLDSGAQHLIRVTPYGTYPRAGDITRHLVVAADNRDTVVAHNVSDATSVRLAGLHLAITVVDGGGTVSPTTLVTDAYGEARFDWHLGPAVGLNALHIESENHQFAIDYLVTSNPALPR